MTWLVCALRAGMGTAPGRCPVSLCGRLFPSTRGAGGTPTPREWRSGYCNNYEKWAFSNEVAGGCCSESAASLGHPRDHTQHLGEVSRGSSETGHGERGTVCLEDFGLAKDAAPERAAPLRVPDWLE